MIEHAGERGDEETLVVTKHLGAPIQRYPETISLGIPFLAAFLDPGAWGRSFTSALDDYSNMAGMWIIGEDMPQESNRVTLDKTVKDKNGMPVASVHFDDHPNDVAMRQHGFQQGAAVYDAVGAIRTIQTTPYPSTHNLGTNRMSEKPADGVVNKCSRRTTSRTCSCRMAASSRRGPDATRR